jgi:hypothetical protein
MIGEEMGLDKNAVHRIMTENLNIRKKKKKNSAEIFACEAKSEPVGNLAGFHGKTRN